MATNTGTDNTYLPGDLESLLKERRNRLETMNERLARYKQKNQLMLEKEEELDRRAHEKYEQEQRQKEDKERLEKERQELYAELQRQQTAQQAIPQPRSTQTTTLSPSTSPALTSSQHQQPTSFPTRSDSFGKVSEQEAIAWLKQQW